MESSPPPSPGPLPVDISKQKSWEEARSDKNARRYVFTSFGDPPTINFDWDALHKKVKFLVYQTERCPSTGRLHIQGFVHLSNSMKYATVCKLLGLTKATNFGVARGSDEENEAYCTKPESREEGPAGKYGKAVPGQGKASDIDSVVQYLTIPEMTMRRVANERPDIVLRHSKHAEKLIELRNAGNKRRIAPNIIIRCGPTGTGKSHATAAEALAWELETGRNVVYVGKLSDRFAFDGYESGDSIAIEEYTPGDCKISLMLRIFDMYPYKVGKIFSSK